MNVRANCEKMYFWITFTVKLNKFEQKKPHIHNYCLNVKGFHRRTRCLLEMKTTDKLCYCQCNISQDSINLFSSATGSYCKKLLQIAVAAMVFSSLSLLPNSYRFCVDNWQQCAFRLFSVQNHATKTCDVGGWMGVRTKTPVIHVEKKWGEDFIREKNKNPKKAIVCTWNCDICVCICAGRWYES